MSDDPNLWSVLYANDIPHEQTLLECDFIEHFMPRTSHPALLDLACGAGRHSIELARRGYTMTGSDVDPKALEVASIRAMEEGREVTWLEANLESLDQVEGQFDGIVFFWQSFGFFDVMTQNGIFTEMRKMLRGDGRLILDIYNRLHFSYEGRLGEDLPSTATVWQDEEKISTSLSYEEELQFRDRSRVEIFDPHLFTPGEIAGIVANHGFRSIAACSEYSPNLPATHHHPLMQLVFEAHVS